MSGLRSGDPAGRGRILQAALRRFAADGYERASLRAIAQEAQASVTLITYHFGSKRRLLDAVDDSLRETFEQAAARTRSGKAAQTTRLDAFAASIGSLMASRTDVREYLRRMVVVDQTAEGTRLLQSLLALAREFADEAPTPADEPRWTDRALRFLLLALGPTLVGPALQRCMPDAFEPSAADAPPTLRLELSGDQKPAGNSLVRGRKPRAEGRRR